MYRSIVAVYSSLDDAPELRRELEDSGVPPSQVQISTEEQAVPATRLPAHEPRGFTDWLFGGSSWPFCCNSQVASLGSYDNTFSSVQRT